MYKHFIIREYLYPEEVYNPQILNQQICVNFDYEEEMEESFELIKQNSIYIQGEKMNNKSCIRSSTIKVIFYVTTDALALELATRWINESKQKNKGYKIIGIDRYYSALE